ncbi:MAG: MazG nucleotide pyrophosphohydrolase domain-containing protein [Halobacteriaceae archaeon]
MDIGDAQQRVAAFITAEGIETSAPYRTLDLVSEIGEIAKEILVTTDYGGQSEPDIPADELGDVLFATLALCERVNVDAEEALGTALEKYNDRVAEGDGPGSGAN